MLASSVLYFALFAYFASTGRFGSIFISALGHSTAEVGLVMAIGSASSLVVRPFVGHMFDRVPAPGRTVVTRRLFVVSTCLASAATVALSYMPVAQQIAGTSGLVATTVLWSLTCCALAPMYSVSTALAMSSLHDTRDWGRTRLWGAASWGLVNALWVGPAVEFYGAVAALPVINVLTAVALLCSVHFVVLPNFERAQRSLSCPEMPVVADSSEAGPLPAPGGVGEGVSDAPQRRPCCRGGRRIYSQLLGGGGSGAKSPTHGRRLEGVIASLVQVCAADGLSSCSFLLFMLLFGAGTSLVVRECSADHGTPTGAH